MKRTRFFIALVATLIFLVTIVNAVAFTQYRCGGNNNNNNNYWPDYPDFDQITNDDSSLGDPRWASRLSGYFNFTMQLSPEWNFTVMPGDRFEVGRGDGDPKDNYQEELYIRPSYNLINNNDVKLKLGLWYYYFGFLDRENATYTFLHNIDLTPTIEVKIDEYWSILDRLIL